MKEIEKILKCVKCGGELKKEKNNFKCKKCQKSYTYRNKIFNCLETIEKEKEFSRIKWEDFYIKYFEDFDKQRNIYQKYGVDQIKKYSDVNKNTVFLELGCGAFYLGNLMSKECKMVIGIDFSKRALERARILLEKRNVKNYLLIYGDIFNIPLKNEVVDLVYGGGVMEHFKNTEECVKEFGRIIKKKGQAINAVPMINLGTLTYRQRWGNIPDLPVIKQIAEFIHIKVLGGKHMYFGYELSFTKRKLLEMHLRNGFKDIEIKRLDTNITLDFLPKYMRPWFKILAQNCSWFWPMVLVIAKK